MQRTHTGAPQHPNKLYAPHQTMVQLISPIALQNAPQPLVSSEVHSTQEPGAPEHKNLVHQNTTIGAWALQNAPQPLVSSEVHSTQEPGAPEHKNLVHQNTTIGAWALQNGPDNPPIRASAIQNNPFTPCLLLQIVYSVPHLVMHPSIMVLYDGATSTYDATELKEFTKGTLTFGFLELWKWGRSSLHVWACSAVLGAQVPQVQLCLQSPAALCEACLERNERHHQQLCRPQIWL